MSSTPEAEWDEEQAGWMLALRLHRQGLCPGCSGNLEITAAPENEERFHPLPPIQCFRCAAISRSQDDYKDEKYPTSFLHLVPKEP